MNTKMQNNVIIHKEGEEGVLTVDRMTGRITSPHEERPDWAEGYATAILAERHQFYATRLGQDSQAFQNIINAAAIEASDLSWVGVDAEGDEREIEADNEFRNGVLAQALGINEETGELGGTIIASVELDRDHTRMSSDEMAALEQSLEQPFGEATQADRAKANGTR